MFTKVAFVAIEHTLNEKNVMRILILSSLPWAKDNSFGNSYSSIFSGIEGIEIAHIYLLDGTPDYEPNIKRYYQIREDIVIKSFFSSRKGIGVGQEVTCNAQDNVRVVINKKSDSSWYGKLLYFGKKHHWTLLTWAREFAWKYGNVNYKGLMDFVEDFKPDIFFLPFINEYKTNRLALYIKSHYDVPMVSYMAMDHYSLKRFSLNPLFWIDRFIKRSMIRHLSQKIEALYCISNRLKNELESSLNVPCKILYKFPSIDRSTTPYSEVHTPVKFLFTGNIYSNRWKSLTYLARALKEEEFGHLDIYTANPITNNIRCALSIDGVSEIHPPVSQNEVINLQNKADVLVHAESFDLKNKLLVRCAISTKIMDYLSVGRSILAIGPSDIASIEYLADDDLAFVANSEKDVHELVKNIKRNPDLLLMYSRKGHEFIERELNPIELRKELYNDLMYYINEYKNKI